MYEPCQKEIVSCKYVYHPAETFGNLDFSFLHIKITIKSEMRYKKLGISLPEKTLNSHSLIPSCSFKEQRLTPFWSLYSLFLIVFFFFFLLFYKKKVYSLWRSTFTLFKIHDSVCTSQQRFFTFTFISNDRSYTAWIEIL